MTRYKFLRLIDGAIRSEKGDCTWVVGEQHSLEGTIELCGYGYHCSKRAFDAFSYVKGEILAEVAVSGNSDIGSDKEAWQHMRIVRAWLWQKQDSVALAIYAAELAIEYYEKLYPEDDRPRKAIEAARRWLNVPNQENQDAASCAAAYAANAAANAAYAAADAAAGAANAAYAAAYAADAAAYVAYAAASCAAAGSANAAANAANAAADAAANAANAAADAAANAAYEAYAAGSAEIITKIEVWMQEHIRQLQPFQ